MKNAIAILGTIVFWGCALVGFVWMARIIADQWGAAMGMVAVLFFPATASLMPWYAGVVLGNWWPLALIWGGAFVGTICADLLKVK